MNIKDTYDKQVSSIRWSHSKIKIKEISLTFHEHNFWPISVQWAITKLYPSLKVQLDYSFVNVSQLHRNQSSCGPFYRVIRFMYDRLNWSTLFESLDHYLNSSRVWLGSIINLSIFVMFSLSFPTWKWNPLLSSLIFFWQRYSRFFLITAFLFSLLYYHSTILIAAYIFGYLDVWSVLPFRTVIFKLCYQPTEGDLHAPRFFSQLKVRNAYKVLVLNWCWFG